MLALLVSFAAFIAMTADSYILVQQQMAYSSAQAYCRSQYGTDLASIHSDDDNNAAKDLCRQTDNSCFVGLSDIEREGIFAWEDGTAFDYGSDISGGVYPWEPDNGWGGEPNNSPNNEDCVILWYEPQFGADDHDWNDSGCSGTFSFICNAPPTPSPTPAPTQPPSTNPSLSPTEFTLSPTHNPTAQPTISPTVYTQSPTKNPSSDPTLSPTSDTQSPTKTPSFDPSQAPNDITQMPTNDPTQTPSEVSIESQTTTRTATFVEGTATTLTRDDDAESLMQPLESDPVTIAIAALIIVAACCFVLVPGLMCYNFCCFHSAGQEAEIEHEKSLPAIAEASNNAKKEDVKEEQPSERDVDVVVQGSARTATVNAGPSNAAAVVVDDERDDSSSGSSSQLFGDYHAERGMPTETATAGNTAGEDNLSLPAQVSMLHEEGGLQLAERTRASDMR